MKFLVLALDFDGTIAQNDVLDPDVRKAIAALRAQGIVVVLVTGRILEDLRRVAGDLHFFGCGGRGEWCGDRVPRQRILGRARAAASTEPAD